VQTAIGIVARYTAPHVHDLAIRLNEHSIDAARGFVVAQGGGNDAAVTESRIEGAGREQAAVLQHFEAQANRGRSAADGFRLPCVASEQGPHGYLLRWSRSAIQWRRQRRGRADRALGRCEAGECFAWRRKLTGRFCFVDSAIPWRDRAKHFYSFGGA